jgi:hypothetical protein
MIFAAGKRHTASRLVPNMPLVASIDNGATRFASPVEAAAAQRKVAAALGKYATSGVDGAALASTVVVGVGRAPDLSYVVFMQCSRAAGSVVLEIQRQLQGSPQCLIVPL